MPGKERIPADAQALGPCPSHSNAPVWESRSRGLRCFKKPCRGLSALMEGQGEVSKEK